MGERTIGPVSYTHLDVYKRQVLDGDGADPMGQGGDVGVSSWKPSAASAGGTVITSGGQPIGMDASDDEDDGALKPLPERLVMELTAHRTLALREAVGRLSLIHI